MCKAIKVSHIASLSFENFYETLKNFPQDYVNIF